MKIFPLNVRKKNWEKHISDFTKIISSEIPINQKWEITKMRVNVYPKEENGLKKRGGSLHRYHNKIILQKENAEKVFTLFKEYSRKIGLKVERNENNEKYLNRYDFQANNKKTDDSLRCLST